MNGRTQARHLVMVNWRGITFQPFELDEHVTVLEGDNGAGKTTAMAAALVVLMPDQRYLHLTSVGESTASGGDRGLYGRLGDPAQPSWAAIDVRLTDGARCIVGVQIDQKSPPLVDITPFVIDGVDPQYSLKSLFLDTRYAGEWRVPDRATLRELVAIAGGKAQFLNKHALYFDLLFERGIVPMRMSDDSEALKHWADLLRTSMSGGLSRLVTSGLKNFLLRPEDNLSRTLEEIRKNLVDCRMTHKQVKDAKEVHKHITTISEAGKTMLSSAANAVCTQEQDARDAHAEGNRKAEAALDRRDQTAAAVAEAGDAVAAAEEDADQTEQTARDARDRAEIVSKALTLYTALNRESARLIEHEQDLEKAQEQFRHADQAHGTARDYETRMRDAAHAAATALHNAQQEHEVAQSRYIKHRAAVERMTRLLAGTGKADIPTSALPALVDDLRAALDGLTDQLNTMDRKLRSAERDRNQYDAALSALSRIEEGSGAGTPVERGMAVLTRAQLAAFEATQLPAWRTLRDRLRQDAAKRTAAETLAASLRPALPALTYEAVQDAETRCQTRVKDLEEKHAADKAQITTLEQEITSLGKQSESVLSTKAAWQAAHDQAANIARLAETQVASADDVRRIWQAQTRRASDLTTAVTRMEKECADAKNLEQALAGVGLGVSTRIASARDIVGGTLLIDQYESTPLDRAAHVQAALGPWIEAIQVPDIASAASAIITMEDPPAEVRLLTPDSLPPGDDGDAVMVGPDHILVHDGPGRRLARLSEAPAVGRLARERRLEDLRTDIRIRESDLAGKRSEKSDATALAEAANRLLPQAGHLGTQDPVAVAADIARRVAELKRQRAALMAGQSTTGLELSSARKHLGTTRDLLRLGGGVLDGHDVHERLAASTALVETSERTQAWWKRHTPALAIVEQAMPILRDPPLTREAMAAMTEARSNLEAQATAAQQVYDDARVLALEPEPLQWTDAEVAFRSLEGRWDVAQRTAKSAQATWEGAIAKTAHAAITRDAARQAYEHADGQVTRTRSVVSGMQQDFTRLGIAEPTADLVENARVEAERARSEANTAQRKRVDAAAKHGRLQNQLEVDSLAASEATAEATRLQAAWEPVRVAWGNLRGMLERERLLAYCTLDEGRRLPPLAYWNTSQRAVGSLITSVRERTATSRDEGRQQVVEALTEVKAQTINGPAAVTAWLAVNAWVQTWLPSRIATAADLFLTLQRHREHLDMLDAEYRRHEESLGTQTKNIARKLTNARAAAIANINALNTYLGQARFGGILGVRIQHERNQQAERALAIMRGDGNQQMVWDSERSFAESLGEILEEQDGDPERYLDYRTYIDLHVQVQRSDGSWTEARSQTVSTGEAIGTGFSLMVSTLLHWESVYGPVARGGQGGRSMRLLFLDEVSRLDLESQSSLTRLCAQGELQILIAAPSFAGGESSTVYRLTRIGGAQGQVRANRVVVRVGRRQETP